MTHNLTDFLNAQNNKKLATASGTKIHTLLKNIKIDSVFGNTGDAEIIAQIQKHSELIPFFAKSAKTEVPIAGNINGIFISRRIDRLLINKEDKTIFFIDYKSDTDKQTFIDKYTKQLTEYARLLKSAYPDYKITGYILWLQDWQLEKVI